MWLWPTSPIAQPSSRRHRGLGGDGPDRMDIPEDEFGTFTNINDRGTVNGIQVPLRRMLAIDQGAITQVASTIMERAVPPQRPYSGST